jgi:hypothetical protein
MILRLACALVITTLAAPVTAQSTTAGIHVWKVVWQDVSRQDGTTVRVPVFVFQERHGDRAAVRAPAEVAAVVKIDEQFRVARAEKDAAQIAHLVSEDFYGTDPDGNRIDRQQLLDAVVGSTIRAVDSRTAEYRVAAGAVIVSGEQEITTASGRQRTEFTRVYSRDPYDQDWHLISSAEMRPRR